MKKQISLLMLGVFVLSACCPMVSENPLSRPNQATVDSRLVGSWRWVSEKADPVWLHIGKLDANKMVAVIAEFKGDANLETTRFPFFVTASVRHGYLNIRLEDIADEAMPEVKGYVFAKYEITAPEKLTCFSMALQPVIAAIQAGALKGRIDYRARSGTPEKQPPAGRTKMKIASVTITDTSSNLLRFLEHSDHSVFFTDPMVFQRVE